MALMKSSEVPHDAVKMTEVEATKYVWDLVGDWDSFTDVWALRYGSVFLGGLNALSGMVVNRYYRNKLKLGSYGYISSIVPITVMPAMLTALYHRHLISTDMLLMKTDVCPVCYELKSSLIQLGMGIAYPMVLGPASALMFANRYSTFRVPQLTEGPKKMFTFLQKVTKPFQGTLAILIVTQFVCSSVVTYFEMKNNFTMRNKIFAIEEKFTRKELKDR